MPKKKKAKKKHPKKHHGHHPKRAKAKKKKHGHHHRVCVLCGHRAVHGKAGCMHVSGNKICPCKG